MEITPPPVIQQPPRQYWTWGVFGLLAAFLIASNLVALLMDSSGRVREKDPLDAARLGVPMAIKLHGIYESLAAMPGGEVAKTQAGDALKASRDQFVAQMDKSDEAAAYVLALDTVAGNPLDERALDRLLLSADKDFAEIGEAFDGRLEDPNAIESDDVYAKIARWKVENPGVEDFPLRAIGLEANPLVLFGYLGYLMLAFLGGVVALCTFLALKLGRRLPSVGYQPFVTPIGVDARGGRMMFYFATFLVLSLVLGLLLAAFKGIDAVVAQTGLYFMLILMTPLFATFPIFGDRIGFKEIIGDTTRIWSKIGWAVGGFMANLPLALMALWVGSSLFSGLPTPSHEAVEMLRASSGPMQTLLLFFTVAVAAPLIEEPMFRGVMLPAFQKSLRSPIWAIVLSSVIFAVIHPQGPMLWPALACVGATAAILTRQTGSLIPAIIMHGLHNATIFGLSVVLN